MKQIRAMVLSLAMVLLCSLSMLAQQKAVTDGPETLGGSGTANYLPLWTSSTTLGNSHFFQSGGNNGIGTTSPKWALDVAGHINSSSGYLIGESLVLTMPGGIANGNLALGFQTLLDYTNGTYNTAIGSDALLSNTSGTENTAVGAGALESNVQGVENTAVGMGALSYNITGESNTALGYGTMSNGTDQGDQNTAVGQYALGSNGPSGSNNVAVGFETLGNNGSGSNNIAIGTEAAINVSGGNSNNIHIGSMGSSGDSGAIRIGTSGTQTSFFVSGVRGVTTGDKDALPVVIDSNGQMGTVSSSRRFKEDIRDMGDASENLMRLRPVTFRYQRPFADGSQPIQYGLIAEEVAEVYPDLVAHSADGQIEAVKYQLLDPMLLNEVQRQQAEIRDLKERLNKMEATLSSMSHAPETR
jgi:hypothetical protein